MKFDIILTVSLCFLFLIFITPIHAFSFNDIIPMITNIFGRITGYTVSTTGLEQCQYECCPANDPGYTEKACPELKYCKDYKCMDIETTTTTVAGTTTPIVANEEVKCVFSGSISEQKCFTDDWKFSCSGVGSCIAYASGVQGTKLTWKSSCSGESYTVIDAYGETVEFKCEAITTTQPQTPIPVETTTTPASTCTDSDGGKNYNVKGISRDRWGEKTDYCDNEKQITEYYCQYTGYGGDQVLYTISSVDCPYGCKDGACLPQPAPVCGNGIC